MTAVHTTPCSACGATDWPSVSAFVRHDRVCHGDAIALGNALYLLDELEARDAHFNETVKHIIEGVRE